LAFSKASDQSMALGEVVVFATEAEQQLAEAVAVFAEQQLFAFAGLGLAMASAIAGGVTLFRFAQASFCEWLKQQHDFQHCSAELHPQRWPWQG
jgi:hypothetical protein